VNARLIDCIWKPCLLSCRLIFFDVKFCGIWISQWMRLAWSSSVSIVEGSVFARPKNLTSIENRINRSIGKFLRFMLLCWQPCRMHLFPSFCIFLYLFVSFRIFFNPNLQQIQALNQKTNQKYKHPKPTPPCFLQPKPHTKTQAKTVNG